MTTTAFINRNDRHDATTGAITITQGAAAAAVSYITFWPDVRASLCTDGSGSVATRRVALSGRFVSTDNSLGRSGDLPISPAVSFVASRRLIFSCLAHEDIGGTAVVKLELSSDGTTWYAAALSDSSANNLVGGRHIEITADSSGSLWRLRCSTLIAGACVDWSIRERVSES